MSCTADANSERIHPSSGPSRPRETSENNGVAGCRFANTIENGWVMQPKEQRKFVYMGKEAVR